MFFQDFKLFDILIFLKSEMSSTHYFYALRIGVAVTEL